MSAIAKVIVDISLDREFDYIIPDELAGSVHLGSRVVVPFGRSERTGYVARLVEQSERTDLKAVRSVVGEKPFIGESVLELARWMSEYYCTPVEKAIRAVLPGAVRRKRAAFKERLFVSLVAAGDATEAKPAKLSPKQARVVEILTERGDTALEELVRLAGTTASPVRVLERKGIVTIQSERVLRDPSANKRILPTRPLTLSAHQAQALADVREAIEAAGRGEAGVVLLYGVTGSGKTEVYLQAIDHVIKQGGGAIVLVPEISLTPQTVERFRARFGERIAVLHSHLSEGERHDEWHRVHDGRANIVVGARSAVFAPVHRLGLIVVDEEHEPSYKQEDAPRYNARDVAVMRGRFEKCAVVLGSATPALESWHNAHTGKYRLSKLPERVDDRRLPSMRIVDMRLETQRTGSPSVFSAELMNAIRARLDKAEQTILFLNRRGYATSLVCPMCGHVSMCGDCSVSFTYHRQDEKLLCHLCGASRSVPPCCPSCKDPSFKFTGIGTQRVESIVRKCFPQAGVQRMDTDVTTTKGSYDTILGDFRVGKTDILIGTQMIAKGLHFPNVTLVGVIYADLSLHMPDFRAGERTFQLLAQVAGRAGRGDVHGEVIVQTYTPFHAAVQAARRVDYEGFCDQENEFRRELRYPPYTHLLCIAFRGRSEEKVAYCARALAAELDKRMPEKVTVSDSAPAPIPKARGAYRFQVMLRSTSVGAMVSTLREVMQTFKAPDGVSITLDVDAMSLL